MNLNLKQKKSQFRRRSHLAALFLAIISTATSADSLTLIQPLTIGTFAITKNTSPSTITVHLDGRTTTSNSIGLIDAGTTAEYLLSTFPPYTYVNVTASILTPQTSSIVAPLDSAQFDVINITTPAFVQTDISGNASLFVGITLRTSGVSGEFYYNAPYTARYLISVDY